MNVLSLFDGMSCGRIALEEAGIKVNKYYASEIDKYATKASEGIYKDIVRLGDVTKWREWGIDWGSIDLVLAGSPCQGFSIAGKQDGFEDPRSKLFFEFVDILEMVLLHNPVVKFLLENVRMKKEYLDFITLRLGFEPVYINSALVSAQNRVRYYWTNIEGVNQPNDEGILLKDIVHENVDVDRDKAHCLDANYHKGASYEQYKKKHRRQLVFQGLEKYIVPFDTTLKILDKEVERGKVGYFRQDSHANRVYYIHGKAVTLLGDAGGGAAKMGQYLFGVINRARGNNSGGLRNNGSKSPTLSSNSWEQNNHLIFGCITPDRVNKRQNGQRFNTGEKFYTLTAQDKHGVLVEGYIRKLTPRECGRLQTVPEHILDIMLNCGVSDSQLYKMFGNGWTIKVISHILKNLNKED